MSILSKSELDFWPLLYMHYIQRHIQKHTKKQLFKALMTNFVKD